MTEPSNFCTYLPNGSESDNKPHVIPVDCWWNGDWQLAGDLVIEIQTCKQEGLAVAHQLTLEERGAGASLEEAVRDLLTSLSEYRGSLEEQEERLGAPAVVDLAKLRKILRRRSHRQG